ADEASSTASVTATLPRFTRFFHDAVAVGTLDPVSRMTIPLWLASTAGRRPCTSPSIMRENAGRSVRYVTLTAAVQAARTRRLAQRIDFSATARRLPAEHSREPARSRERGFASAHVSRAVAKGERR